jgi:hypothetical protein
MVARFEQELEIIDTDQMVLGIFLTGSQYHKQLSTLFDVSSDLRDLQMERLRYGATEFHFNEADAFDLEIRICVDRIEIKVLAVIAAAAIFILGIADRAEPSLQQYPFDTIASLDFGGKLLF